MFFGISVIYLIIPFFIFLFSFVKKRKSIFILIILLAFVYLFSLSLSSPDYLNYKYYYEQVAIEGFSAQINAEPLFKALMILFNSFNIQFSIFYILSQIVALVTFFIIDFLLCKHFKINIFYTLLIAYFSYFLYFMTAVRQFYVMIIFLYAIYFFHIKNKKFVPILLSFISIFIHKVAVLSLFVLILLMLFERKIKLNVYVLIMLALCCRIILYCMSDFIFYITNYPSFDEPVIFNFSSIFKIINAIVIYNMCGARKLDFGGMENYYYIGVFLILIVPYDISLRISEYFLVLECFILPKIVSKMKHTQKLVLLCYLVVTMGYMWYSHIAGVGTYNPYCNILF